MVAAGNSRKELDKMKSRIFVNGDRTAKVEKITIPIHGKGGELGIKAVTGCFNWANSASIAACGVSITIYAVWK